MIFDTRTPLHKKKNSKCPYHILYDDILLHRPAPSFAFLTQYSSYYLTISATCGTIMWSSLGPWRLSKSTVQSDALTSFKPFMPSWSNILALLTAPFEAIETVAVGNLFLVSL